MGYLNQAYDELITEKNVEISKPPVNGGIAKADIKLVDNFPTYWADPLMLTNILNDFVVDQSDIDRMRECTEYLIQENGAEWVWENKDIVSDLLEFHGFNRKRTNGTGETVSSQKTYF